MGPAVSDGTLTTYAELAQVIDLLPVLVRARRRADRLSIRAAAAQAGMSFSTLARVENGEQMSGESLKALLLWLDRAPGALVPVEESDKEAW